MENQVYLFSGSSIKLVRQRSVVLIVIIPAAVLITILLSPLLREAIVARPALALLLLLVIEVPLVLSSRSTLQKLKQTSLAFDGSTIIRASGNMTERIALQDIRRVEIHTLPSGEISFLKLEVSGGAPVYLQGFERMDVVAAQVEQQAAGRVEIIRRQMRVNWGSPYLLVTVGVVAVTVVLLIQTAGQQWSDLITFLFAGGLGIHLFIARPLTQRLGKRFQPYERILGGVLVLAAVVLFIVFLVQR